MGEEKCSQCDKELVSGEQIRCVYCELNQVKVNAQAQTIAATPVSGPEINCGICNLITIQDKQTLHCELCKLWYHNGCIETALDDRYCSLMYEAPKNIKWFCDKCIAETETWSNADRNDTKYLYFKPKIERASGIVSSKIETTKIETTNGTRSTRKKPKIRRPLKKKVFIKKENDADDEDGDSKKKVGRVGKRKIKHRCDDCPKTFCDTQIFVAHTLWHSGDKRPYKCLECGKGFITKRKLRDHTDMHSNKRKYICEICGKGYNGEGLLKRHVDGVHCGEKPFSCPKCELKFKRKFHFAKHLTTCDGIETPCPLCDYVTKRRWTLKAHMRTHSDEKLFNCKVCGINLKTPDGLKIHMATHSDEKPFKCEICQRGFKHKPNLRTHMVVHNPVKNFFCPICGTGFPSKDRLDKHVRIHSDEKPWECERCGTKYKTKRNMKLHQRRCIHGETGTHRRPSKSIPKPKQIIQNTISDSNTNSNDSVHLRQYIQQPPPPPPPQLLYYTGVQGTNELRAPVYSSSHVTATIHCPPPTSYSSVFTGHY